MGYLNLTLKKIKEILREVDVLSLISSGAPDDEYDGEANILYSILMNPRAESDIENVLNELFRNSFNLSELPEDKMKLLKRKVDDALQTGTLIS